jgi:uncharacterized protein (TIGR03085 family)
VVDLDARERAELCDLLDEVGPDAPTLCEGWAAIDLAAHLVVRERDPRAAMWILGGERFAALERSVMGKARARGFAALVEAIRRGPPVGPFRIPGVRTLLNLNEYFVHHEDVRRANGRGPRDDRADLDAALWTYLRRGARLQLRKVRAAVTLDAPGHGVVRAGSGPPVTVRGGPQELVLYLNGRRQVAAVAVTGSDDGVAALAAAKLGV